MSGLHDQLHDVLERAASATSGTALAAEVADARARLGGPLRLAIAGRVKAGKSTLLNALVGEGLAQTDAGECTRIVTWYQEGPTYAVRGVLHDGRTVDLPFRRGERAVEIDLDGRHPDELERVEVDWPSSALRHLTLIDTPGLESFDDATSARTERFLGTDRGSTSSADAVVYLMRHVHRRDADFLDSFRGRPLAHVSPLNAVAVLSRADEVGAGRLDALDSARRIADRYRLDARIRSLCGDVVAVAGLAAEAAAQLQERDVAALRTIATQPPAQRDDLLVSVERFTRAGADVDVDLDVDTRAALLDRLGLFGVRFAVEQLRSDPSLSAPALARSLVRESGIAELRLVIEERFVPRAEALQARAVLATLTTVANRLHGQDPAAGRSLAADVEAIVSGAHVFEELRLAHAVLVGDVELPDDAVAEVRRVTGAPSLTARLGLAPDATDDEVRRSALVGVERWRARAAEPFASPTLRAAAEAMARSYEAAYAAAGEPQR